MKCNHRTRPHLYREVAALQHCSMQPLSTRAGTAGPHTAASPCPLCPLCPLCPGAAKTVRRYASHCTNLQTTAHPSDAVVSVRQVAFAGELSIRHKTVRQNSCKWHAQGRRGALCDAMAYCTCITSGNCDAQSRALRSITLWTPHAGHASARTALALLSTPAQPLAHAILTRSRPKHRPTASRCAISTFFDHQPARHCVSTLQSEL